MAQTYLETTYYASGDVAYTEDNVLIYNIYAYNIPKELSYDELLLMFEQHGEVVHFHLTTRDMFYNSARIHYKDPKDACRVLNSWVFYHQNCWITACDSWKQPNAKFAERYANRRLLKDHSVQQLADSSNMNILELNDNCLAHICQYLSLVDQIRFAFTNKRFCAAFRLTAKLKLRKLNAENLKEFTLWEVLTFLKLVGEFLDEFKAYSRKDDKRILNFISKYAKNISTMDLSGCLNMPVSLLENVFSHLKDITNLDLRYCCLDDDAISTLQQLPKLQILSLAGNDKLTGEHLACLKTIVSLDLSYCRSVESKYFIAMFESLKKLESLNIVRNTNADASACKALAEHRKYLKTLTFSLHANKDVLLSVAQSLHLIQLDIVGDNVSHLYIRRMKDVIFTNSRRMKILKFIDLPEGSGNDRIHLLQFISQFTELEKLYIRFSFDKYVPDDTLIDRLCVLTKLKMIDLSYWDFTDSDLLKLVKRCPMLHYVDIYFCKFITTDLIYSIIDYRKNCFQNFAMPITFHVRKTNIPESFLHDSIYVASKHLVCCIW